MGKVILISEFLARKKSPPILVIDLVDWGKLFQKFTQELEKVLSDGVKSN